MDHAGDDDLADDGVMVADLDDLDHLAFDARLRVLQNGGARLTHTVNSYFDQETSDEETDPPENRFTSPFDQFTFAVIRAGKIP